MLLRPEFFCDCSVEQTHHEDEEVFEFASLESQIISEI